MVKTATVVLGVAVSVAFAGACEKTGPLRVDHVEPAEGVTGGGDHVVVVGSGFLPGKTQVEVRFGRRKAEQVIISSTTKIAVITPLGDRGPVDVTLAFDDGSSFKIPGGFRYLAPPATGDVRKAFFSGQAEKK